MDLDMDMVLDMHMDLDLDMDMDLDMDVDMDLVMDMDMDLDKKFLRISSIHGGHASPKKHRVVQNFLSFCSVILKLGTKKELVIL